MQPDATQIHWSVVSGSGRGPTDLSRSGSAAGGALPFDAVTLSLFAGGALGTIAFFQLFLTGRRASITIGSDINAPVASFSAFTMVETS